MKLQSLPLFPFCQHRCADRSWRRCPIKEQHISSSCRSLPLKSTSHHQPHWCCASGTVQLPPEALGSLPAVLLLDGVSVELLSRGIRVTWVPLGACVSLRQAGAVGAPCRSFSHCMAAECSLGGALAPVMQMLCERSCRACPHTSG